MCILKENELGVMHPAILGLSFDSRTIKPGDLFLAFKGNNYDGHDYVLDAFKKGASCALVSRYVCENNIIVDSVLDQLIEIAKKKRSECDAVFIAITGSVGKTTARNIIADSLIRAGKKVYQPIKNYNNLLGVAFTLAQIPSGSDFVIMEIGTDFPGEIDLLTKLIKPDYSLITHIGSAHIASFGSLFNILCEKSDIINATKKKIFFNDAYWYGSYLRQKASKFGIEYAVFSSFNGSFQDLYSCVEKVLSEFNIKIDRFFWPSGRGEIIDVTYGDVKLQIIDSSYNANFFSMKAAISQLQEYENLHKIAVLSDMKALGLKSFRYHELLQDYLYGLDVVLYGNEMKFLHLHLKNSVWAESWQKLIEIIEKKLVNNSILLFKGSNDADFLRVVECFKNQ